MCRCHKHIGRGMTYEVLQYTKLCVLCTQTFACVTSFGFCLRMRVCVCRAATAAAGCCVSQLNEALLSCYMRCAIKPAITHTQHDTAPFRYCSLVPLIWVQYSWMPGAHVVAVVDGSETNFAGTFSLDQREQLTRISDIDFQSCFSDQPVAGLKYRFANAPMHVICTCRALVSSSVCHMH